MWVLMAALGIEKRGYEKIGQSDFDYHWVGAVTETEATVVVTVQPYKGNTLVEFVHGMWLYFDGREDQITGTAKMHI